MVLLQADEIMRLDVKINPPELVGAVATSTLQGYSALASGSSALLRITRLRPWRLP